MARIETAFFDIGGVCLTNGWDAEARTAAKRKFGLADEAGDIEARHAAVVDAFERGELSLDEYLDRVVFYRSRPFGRDAFIEFMYAQSRPNDPVLALVRNLAAAGVCRLATINNESRALNRYRIETFGLAGIFEAFFSSCYLGVSKPDPRIYAIALDVMQTDPAKSVFVDDRQANVAAAGAAGMRTIHMTDSGRLPRALLEAGVDAPFLR
jgi:putative hydrolase of the HAD superfamily